MSAPLNAPYPNAPYLIAYTDGALVTEEYKQFWPARTAALAHGVPLYLRYDHACVSTAPLITALTFIAREITGLSDSSFDLNDYDQAVITKIQANIREALAAAAEAFGRAAFTDQGGAADGA